MNSSSQLVILHNNNIPEDLVDEILSRLPIKSLLRFKAVSKLWHSAISNPTFQIRRPATRIFAMVKSLHLLFHSIDEKGSIEKFRSPAWCDQEYGKLKNQAVISNSCNGMLLLRLDALILLLNPSTHYIDRVLTLEQPVDEIYDIEMSFCYDESIGDYKVVLFPGFLLRKHAVVASLKEKKWTRCSPRRGFANLLPGPLLNDRLHAIAGNRVIYFNPIKDVFEKLPCPQPKSGDQSYIIGLGVLDGCLCITCENASSRYVKFFVMKEYGAAESWTTLFVFDNFKAVLPCWRMCVLHRTDDGDILIKNRDKIWRYNLANKSCTKFIENGIMNWLDVVTYVENLHSRRP